MSGNQEQSGRGSLAAQIRSELDESLLEEAEDAGIDIDSQIDSVVEEYGDYALKTQVRFARSSISEAISASEGESISGLVCGTRDRMGKNWPRRISLIRSNGDHIEASTWGGSLPLVDGGETRIPSGSAVEMRCEFDEEYESWEANALGAVDDLSAEEFASRLQSVALAPDELSRSDEWETVAVSGEISYINPQTQFVDGEPTGDGDVLEPDDNGTLKPHMEIVVDGEDTRVRGHIEQQSNGDPMFEVTDGMALLRDAHERHQTPEEQANMLMQALRGTEVVIVGNVNSYDRSRSNGSSQAYADIAVTAVVEVDPDTPTDEPADTTSDADSTAGGDESGGEDADPSQVEQVSDDIETYAELTGEDPGSMDADYVSENIQGIDAPDAIITAALDRLTGDVSASSEDEGDGSDGGESSETVSEDADLSSLLSGDDMLECPGEGCIASAPSVAALSGHVLDAHTEDDPEEWMRGKL